MTTEHEMTTGLKSNLIPSPAKKPFEPIPSSIKKESHDPFALDREVLNHQLEGVMFHSDMVLLYTLLNCKEMCEVHWKQLFSEMKTHTCTAKDMIKRYGRIIEARPTEKISVYTSDTVPETEEEVEKLKTLALSEWLAWEHETKELYEKMVALQPHVKMWTELLKDVKMELKAISRLKSR